MAGASRKDEVKELASRPASEEPPKTPPGALLDPPTGLPPLHPYTLAKELDDPDVLKMLGSRARRKLRPRWTPAKVAALTTEEIDERVRELVADHSPERFVALAKGRTSAWDISGVWRQEAGRRLGHEDEDFLGLAACELWKRHCPEPPSVEMISDWMDEGYDFLAVPGRFLAQEDRDRGFDIWWRVWRALVPMFTEEMQTVEEAECVFPPGQFIINWAQDFLMELENDARRAHIAQMGLDFVEEFIGCFPKEDEHVVSVFRAAKGRFHFSLGDREAGEATFASLMEELPRLAIGYVTLAEELVAAHDVPPEDRARSVALLEKARDLPVDDAEEWDLDVRIEDIREGRGRATSTRTS